ncbi:MAG TPA: hypothetical protein VFB84_09200 [Micromonosporaceae bacterium]|nr:hypothetical protein [Micromonosporaceae bacterium]
MTTAAGEASSEEFARTRTGALARTAYLLTDDRDHAEDLVQTALARAAVRWTRLDDPEPYVRRVLSTQLPRQLRGVLEGVAKDAPAVRVPLGL